MSEIIGKPTSRTAKPLIMTLYDWLKTYPYTAKFYVRDDASEEECLEFINAVCAVTECVLGKYTIGFQQYRVPIPDFEERFKAMPNGTMGTQKWVVKYYIEPGFRLRTHSIPEGISTSP